MVEGYEVTKPELLNVVVLFDLDPNTAYAAFFNMLDARRLPECRLYSGYPFADMPGYTEHARSYCIALRLMWRSSGSKAG